MKAKKTGPDSWDLVEGAEIVGRLRRVVSRAPVYAGGASYAVGFTQTTFYRAEILGDRSLRGEGRTIKAAIASLETSIARTKGE